MVNDSGRCEMESRTALRQFIVETFLFGDGDGVKDDTSFLENGVIDSTGILDLIMFMEETFHIKIADEEVVPENFDSIQCLVSFLDRKVALAAQEGGDTGAS